MKLLIALTLVSAVLSCTQEVQNGLAPPTRVCVAVAAGAYVAKQCVSGARDEIKTAIKSCKSSDGEPISAGDCGVDIAIAVFGLLENTAKLGLAVAYGIGNNNVNRNVATIVQRAGQLLTGMGAMKRSEAITGMEERSIESSHAARSITLEPFKNIIGVIPALNLSLPVLSFADVALNHTFPFHFSHKGVISTYFPEGHPDDETMLYTYQLGSRNNATSSEHKREVAPSALDMGVQTRDALPDDGDSDRAAADTCGGTTHQTPYRDFPSPIMNDGYGIKFQSLQTCGHRNPRDSQEDHSSRAQIMAYGIEYMGDNGGAVLETRIDIMVGGATTTYSNNRLIIETRAFDTCEEGMHQQANCCVGE